MPRHRYLSSEDTQVACNLEDKSAKRDSPNDQQKIRQLYMKTGLVIHESMGKSERSTWDLLYSMQDILRCNNVKLFCL